MSCFILSSPQRDWHDGGFEWAAVSPGEPTEGKKKLTVMLTSLTAEKDRWIERDAQRTSRHSGQLSQTDWLNRQVELVFALQKAHMTPVLNVSDYVECDFQVQI